MPRVSRVLSCSAALILAGGLSGATYGPTAAQSAGAATAWPADHGAGVGWTSNQASTGLVVNGNNVTAYGLAVEHYQKNEVIWNGQNGEDIFFQNEMPYDPPSQAAWMSSATTDG